MTAPMTEREKALADALDWALKQIEDDLDPDHQAAMDAAIHTLNEARGKKRFKVTAVFSRYCEAIIEAHNEDEANELARNMSGDQFTHNGDAGDWRIYDVDEVDE